MMSGWERCAKARFSRMMGIPNGAGTQAVFEAARDSRIDLNFPTDQATLERSGNDLIFRFDDGSTVVLRDFYTAYTKDSMPCLLYTSISSLQKKDTMTRKRYDNRINNSPCSL